MGGVADRPNGSEGHTDKLENLVQQMEMLSPVPGEE